MPAHDQSTAKLTEFLTAELSAVEAYTKVINLVSDSVLREQLEELELSHRQRVQMIRRHLTDLGAQLVPDSWHPWADFSGLQDNGDSAFADISRRFTDSSARAHSRIGLASKRDFALVQHDSASGTSREGLLTEEEK